MAQPRILTLRKNILSKNDELARELRMRFSRHGVFVANLVSSPGSGKTELLYRTLNELGKSHRAAAITGDLATEN
ncbi:MAG: hydrogenase accessory protein HypB, partial [Caldilineae bacterium]